MYNYRTDMKGRTNMSNKLFTDTEQKLLSQNPYVKKVSKKGITYTEEFRQLFIVENNKGTLPREIFEACGFDIEILGMSRVRACGKRWRANYKCNGVDGLSDSRGLKSNRKNDSDLTLEEKYNRLLAQNALLAAENDLLKKIKRLERGLEVQL